MKHGYRLISIFLCIVMIIAVLPINETEVSAAGSNGYLSFNEATQKMRQVALNRSSDSVTINVYIEDSRPLGDKEIRDMFDNGIFQHTGKGTEGDYLRYHTTSTSYFVTEHRQEGNQHWITLMFTAYYRQSAANENKVTAKAKQILDSLNLAGKSDYDKILAIYSYICQNVDYELNYEQLTPNTQEHNDIYSAYGAIVNNKAVCEGYALAMYRLLLDAGIDNRLIVSADHAWNLVKLGDYYYNLDSTWDYGISPENFNWFLVGTADFCDLHHSTGEEFNTKEFIQKYPESPISYGKAATATGSGSCGDNASWTLSADGTLTISGSGPIQNTIEGATLWTDLNVYIKKVVIQNGITSIGDYAFWNCPQLSSVSIPSSVTYISSMAFERCRNLKEVTIPNSVTSMGNAVFSGCIQLESVSLSNQLTVIPDSTFNFCMSLKGITIPASIKEIGIGAFASAFDPNANVKLVVPSTVKKVYYTAFAWSGLKSVEWNAQDSRLDGSMFYMNKHLESVLLNDSIIEFGEETFAFCHRLKSIKMPKNLQRTESNIFLDCYALESITIPTAITQISAGLFCECMSLEEVILHEGITEIGNNAFNGCGIKSIVIPASVKSIGEWSFVSPKLQTVTFLGDAPQSYSVNRTFGSFSAVPVTIYYPGSNTTWNATVIQALSESANANWVGVHGANEPHTLGDKWNSDANSHWKQCTGCDYKEQVTAHSYSTDCDESCNTCGYQRATSHTYEWGNNAEQHWCACKCGSQLVAPQNHSYNDMNVCSQCGVTKGNTSNDSVPTVPVEPDPEVTKPTETEPENSKPTEPNTPENTKPIPEESAPTIGNDPTANTPSMEDNSEKTTNFPRIIIILAAIVVVGGISAVIVIVIKKKKAV